MPFTLPGINQLPALASLASAQTVDDQLRKSSVSSNKTSGYDSYRSSVSSFYSEGEGLYRSSTSTSSMSSLNSALFNAKLTASLSSQPVALASPLDVPPQGPSTDSTQAAAGSSPSFLLAGSRSHSVSLPPISELMVSPSVSTSGHHSLTTSPTTATRHEPPTKVQLQTAPPTRPRQPSSMDPLQKRSNSHSPPSYTQHPVLAQALPGPVGAPLPTHNYGYHTPVNGPTTPVGFYTMRNNSVPDISAAGPPVAQYLYFHPHHPQTSTHTPRTQHTEGPQTAYPMMYHQHPHPPPPPPPSGEPQQGLLPAHETKPQQLPQHPYQHQHHHQQQHYAHSSDRAIQAGPPSPPKRVVKRRTRTGCLTCRRRRIKCDERKPHCHNCEKSKIWCAGYQQVRPTKSELKKMNKLMKVGSIIG